ncbi:MAG: hypothetical protein IPP88_15595 [Betaproteobacteria bacterium]|nr:hypothetical protein [Betaproteobacteria bacterium]
MRSWRSIPGDHHGSPLPAGTVGSAYSQQLAVTSAAGTISLARTAGTLPGGLTLSPAGLLSGPPSPGTSTFTVTVTDSFDSTAKDFP